MSALGALSGGAAGVAGLLSLRRRAAPPPSGLASSPHLPSLKCAVPPDAGQLVWGRQLRPALLPAALLPPQPARRNALRPPAAAAGSDHASSIRLLYLFYNDEYNKMIDR